MALTVLVGPRQWDAANYVRQRTSDLSGFEVTDDNLKAYAEPVNEEFSRCIPMNSIVGSSISSTGGPATSPLVTVANQQRYILSPANGFPTQPLFVDDVSYTYSQSASGLTAQSEWATAQMLAGNFTFTQIVIDSPTTRLLRTAQLDELQRLNQGFYSFVIDSATMLPAIDLYPIPTAAGLPLVVRYRSEHTLVVNGLTGNITIPSIPSNKAREWGKLLLLEVLEQRADSMVTKKMVKAGLIERQQDTRVMEQRCNRLREELDAALGYHVGAGVAASH